MTGYEILIYAVLGATLAMAVIRILFDEDGVNILCALGALALFFVIDVEAMAIGEALLGSTGMLIGAVIPYFSSAVFIYSLMGLTHAYQVAHHAMNVNTEDNAPEQVKSKTMKVIIS